MPYSGRCKVCRPSGRAICSLFQHNLKRAWRAGLSTPVTRARSMSKASAAEVPVPSQKFLCLIVSSPAGIGLGALEADSCPARHASMAHHISRLADKALCHENVFKKRAAQSETPANWACLRWCSTLMSKFDSCRALLGTDFSHALAPKQSYSSAEGFTIEYLGTLPVSVFSALAHGYCDNGAACWLPHVPKTRPFR